MDTRRALLEELAEGAASGPTLAESLGVSRAAVWKQVESLREAGFDIGGTDAGYVVRDVPEYGGDAIAFGLDAPYRIEFHDTVGSTNDRARELAMDGASDVVVVADAQSGSRGRLDREWSSPPGGVYLSILSTPDVPPASAPIFTLAAAVATTKAARSLGVDAGIKWPNDVLVPDSTANAGATANTEATTNTGTTETTEATTDTGATGRGGAKLAGVLTEMEGEADRVNWLVAGIGVNANADLADLPPGATSLAAELGEPVDRRGFVQEILETFAALAAEPESVLPQWRRYGLTLGQRVRVDTAGGTIEGEAVDVTFPGGLVVETDSGRETVLAGDCEHLRPAE